MSTVGKAGAVWVQQENPLVKLFLFTHVMGDDDMHDNNNSSNSKIVDNDSNCLHHTSDSNESSSFLNGSSTYEDSKVFFNGLNGCKFYYNSSQD